MRPIAPMASRARLEGSGTTAAALPSNAIVGVHPNPNVPRTSGVCDIKDLGWSRTTAATNGNSLKRSQVKGTCESHFVITEDGEALDVGVEIVASPQHYSSDVKQRPQVVVNISSDGIRIER